MSELEELISFATSVIYGETELPEELVNMNDVRELTSNLSMWAIESFVEAEEKAYTEDEQAEDESVRQILEAALSIAYLIGRLTNPTNQTDSNLPTVLNESIVQKLLSEGTVTLTLSIDD